MALYHFHVDQITRGKGQSAIACAAYRAGEKLYSEYYDEINDFTGKGGVLYSEIILPPHAPPEYKKRETLWNEVEKAECHKKAQLAYIFDIAMQNEFSMEENIALARQFIMEQFVSKGMIADFAVHEPDREDDGIRNPHFHVMAPIRPILPNGQWGRKQRRVYILDEVGNRVRGDNGKWKYNSVPTTDWGTPETLEAWRKAWAVLVNQHFAEKGLDCRIDHRSYERQGVDKLPTIHEGVAVRQMEKKGINTNKGELNRWIRKTGSLLNSLRRKIRELLAWLKEARKKLSPPQAQGRGLSELLNSYFTARNAGAWSEKAKINNLKEWSRIVNYLSEHDLSTLEDLESHVYALETKANELKDTLKQINARKNEVDNLIRLSDDYAKLKPVYEAMKSIRWKSKKEQFKQEHEKELNQFYMAYRKLKYHCSPSGEYPLATWRKESADLEKQYEMQYESYCPLRDQLSRLMKIKHYIDTAISQRVQDQKYHNDIER